MKFFGDRKTGGYVACFPPNYFVGKASKAEIKTILDTAKAHGCSLIAMASHGRRGLGRLVMGSVTAEVLAHSPVPVLVVR